MNDHALDVLEYDKVVEMLVERTSFPPGAERAAALKPSADPDAIEAELGRVSEIRSLLDRGVRVPLEGARDIREAIGRSRRPGAALSAESLADVRRTLETVARARSVLEKGSDSCPGVWQLAAGLEPAPGLARTIGDAIDDETHEVRDRASRELSRLRRAQSATRARLDEKLAAILDREASAGTIQEPAIHIRNGRHVLPVRREARARLEGIVHDRSGTGATLFVEPLATVELNNELAELAVAEREEIHRILVALTDGVRERADEIGLSLGILTTLDVLSAKARLSLDLDGARPLLNREGRIGIREGRHPLLAARGRGAVVPLSISLAPGSPVIVISGPNAGGKTVALKTVGLLTLMAQSGLHVPSAADTAIAVFEDVFADIGDEQSIEQDLSTFSSHLRTIGEILGNAGARTLVLIDELGAGTDPDEGAGLAIAILEELARRNAPTIATTHLGVVKSHVHGHPGMVNGSMAFDPETLEPTFRFVPGVPGASHALAIARAQGLPDGVLSRARELRGEGGARVDDLVADLSRKQQRLDEAVEDAEIRRARALALERDYEGRLLDVREERRRIRGEALAEAREIVDGAQGLVESTVKEIRSREAGRRAIKAARAALAARRTELARVIEDERRPDRDAGGRPPSELAVGMRVRVAGLGREGELLDLPDAHGKVRVRIKSATVEVEAADLREADAADGRSRVKISVESETEESFSDELHLRGMTTDEIGDVIERFLAAATMRGLSTVRIVHGKGTGALRSRTQEILKGLPVVKSFRLGRWGEGDTGVTIVELR
jgi:DNA mismatch repair protein MutS2